MVFDPIYQKVSDKSQAHDAFSVYDPGYESKGYYDQLQDREAEVRLHPPTEALLKTLVSKVR